MIVNEWKKNMQRFKLIRIASFLSLTFCFFAMSMMLSNVIEVNYLNNYMSSSAGNRKGLKLVDSMDESRTLSIFFKDINRLDDLKIFSENLKNAKEFDYTLIYNNPINISYRSWIPAEMYALDKSKAVHDINGEEMVNVKAIEVTDNAKEFYPIVVSEGRSLKEDDYFLTDKKINILMGAEYKDLFKIGDNINIEYWGLTFEASIVGFLDEKSFIIRHDEQVYLENHVILPFLFSNNIPRSEQEVIFQAISYTCFINGIAFIKEGYGIADVTSKIDEWCRKFDIPAFGYEGINSNAIQFLNYVLQLGIEELVVFMIIIYFFSYISFVFIQLYIYSKNTNNYFIHILNGASRNTIAIYCTADILGQLIIPLIFSVAIYSFGIGSLYFSWYLILLVLPILFTPLLKIFYDIYYKYNFCTLHMEEK